MITDKIKELEKLRADTAKLEASIKDERTKELAALPAYYGFDSVAAFAKAVVKAGKGAKVSEKAPKEAKAKKRTRAVVTPEIKAKVVELANEGKTGAEIAKAVGVSLPTIQNIKKAAGLVKARGTSEPSAPVA